MLSLLSLGSLRFSNVISSYPSEPWVPVRNTGEPSSPHPFVPELDQKSFHSIASGAGADICLCECAGCGNSLFVRRDPNSSWQARHRCYHWKIILLSNSSICFPRENKPVSGKHLSIFNHLFSTVFLQLLKINRGH